MIVYKCLEGARTARTHSVTQQPRFRMWQISQKCFCKKIIDLAEIFVRKKYGPFNTGWKLLSVLLHVKNNFQSFSGWAASSIKHGCPLGVGLFRGIQLFCHVLLSEHLRNSYFAESDILVNFSFGIQRIYIHVKEDFPPVVIEFLEYSHFSEMNVDLGVFDRFFEKMKGCPSDSDVQLSCCLSNWICGNLYFNHS